MVAADQRRLRIVLAAVVLYCATEFVGGYFTNSLALMTDAVHMLTELSRRSTASGLLTLWISTRPARGGKTFGYLRAEILGAFLNGLFLWLLVLYIWMEAAHRLRTPETISALPVMGIAVVGLVVNVFSAWMTYDGGGEGGRAGMAVRAAFLHAVSDLIGVAGVFISGRDNLLHRVWSAAGIRSSASSSARWCRYTARVGSDPRRHRHFDGIGVWRISISISGA